MRTRCARASSAAARVVVVGGGWIGCEVAASARQRGVDVTARRAAVVPLEGVLGAEAGAVYPRPARATTAWTCGWRRRRGVRGRRRGRARPPRRRPAIDCDVSPWASAPRRGRLAATAGLAVGDGVLVDEQLRTSAPGVFAAGDVASACHPFYGRARAGRALGQRAQAGAGRGPRRCSAGRPPTTGSRTSSPTSTTSGWSTPASPPPRRPVVFRGDRRRARVHRVLAARRPRRRRDERQRVGRRRADRPADPRAACRSTTGGWPTRTCRSTRRRPPRGRPRSRTRARRRARGRRCRCRASKRAQRSSTPRSSRSPGANDGRTASQLRADEPVSRGLGGRAAIIRAARVGVRERRPAAVVDRLAARGEPVAVLRPACAAR